MKKIFLLSILLFQLTFVFGQVKTENKRGYGMATGDYKPNRQVTPTQNNNVKKNDRSYQNSCYSGFAFTVKNYGYNKDGNHYSWGIKVKNNYTKPVSLRYKLIVGNDNTSPWAKSGTLTYNIKPGESYTNDYGTLMGLIVDSNSDQYRIEISDVCFEGQDCIKNGYADCNGKQSKATINNSTSTNSKNNTISQTNNSNQQTSQQNDLSEYNRSKADLERQLAEKNAEITRQNEENARLGQIWNNAIKVGVDAHNSGNYTEAKNQFTIAINNSSNETNRQNAQNYYNKSVEAEKSQMKIKAIGEITTATVDLINILKSRKRAKNEYLPTSDGEILLKIATEPNPFDYLQNIVQIFEDLGYTYDKTKEMELGGKILYFNDNGVISYPLFVHIFPKNRNQSQNQFSLSTYRKKKLLVKLKCIENNLISNSDEIYIIDKVKDDAVEQFNLGVKYYQNKDYKKAFEYYSKAAEMGDRDAQNSLAVMYANGEGVDKNFVTAFQWYQKSAEQGFRLAQYNLGYNYYKGEDGLDQDFKKAIYWFLRAGEQELPEAQNYIGIMYKKGEGIMQDYFQAFEWYKKAAEQGNKYAQNNLGKMYENGEGVTMNINEAIRLYKLSANQGYDKAIENLKRLEEN